MHAHNWPVKNEVRARENRKSGRKIGNWKLKKLRDTIPISEIMVIYADLRRSVLIEAPGIFDCGLTIADLLRAEARGFKRGDDHREDFIRFG